MLKEKLLQDRIPYESPQSYMDETEFEGSFCQTFAGNNTNAKNSVDVDELETEDGNGGIDFSF